MGGGGGCFEHEEERWSIHAGNYIFSTDVAQLATKKKRFTAQNLGGVCAPCAPAPLPPPLSPR